jgi:hypothetical protein
MYKSFYKTDKQKRAYMQKYASKRELFQLADDWTEFDEDVTLRNGMLSCKTKKELLDKYLNELWEFLWEEYSYA